MSDETPTDRLTQWDDALEPIQVRDPVAEVLGVRESGQPFSITYADVVTAAGHSCPTAAGAFRIAQLGLAALYPESLPTRGEIDVHLHGPRDEMPFGVLGSLLSYVTGAAGPEGFPGLADGFGGRDGRLTDDERSETAGVVVTFTRADTDDAVAVTYRMEAVPELGDAAIVLPKIIQGTASADEQQVFLDAWHGRVRTVLDSDDLFSLTELDRSA